MTVPAKLFQQWLTAVAGGTSHAAVCRAAGIKRSTLAQQLVRGRVSLGTVAAVSRSLDLPVVQSLATFPAFADLPQGIKAPGQAELLSQISDVDLLTEILNRNLASEQGRSPDPVTLTPAPHRSSVRSWIDAIDATDLRQKLARQAAIAPQNLSAQISANRLNPELAIESARIGQVGLTNGLVATGFLTPLEAGWDPEARAAALRATPHSVLASLAAQRLEAMSRILRRVEDDSQDAQSVWENLG
ncbi:hypothetical protein CVS30_03675 [Arthrobacter psychrolactophilus]|uniref:Uncharacterized protein n=1 Tax=Arthrobacter psychrolactophilus TaxID=92442 RepID=A0A2V5IZ84_9MICC|nr:hypothetical protein [Arthrobacter psychrolactophilus]PYI39773.1 hypothetical protein CVS30_03675 [Arthrobacter psychrolactophilus]